jgi:hypothetical protein
VRALEDAFHRDDAAAADLDFEDDLGFVHSGFFLAGRKGDGGFVDETGLGVEVGGRESHLRERSIVFGGEFGAIEAEFGLGLKRGFHGGRDGVELDLQMREVGWRRWRRFRIRRRGRRGRKANRWSGRESAQGYDGFLVVPDHSHPDEKADQPHRQSDGGEDLADLRVELSLLFSH